eukprot:2349201-Amphidinium_carterae.2
MQFSSGTGSYGPSSTENPIGVMVRNSNTRDFLRKALVRKDDDLPDLDEVCSAILNELGGVWESWD